jgi:putative SOS response-associated peptidase YedK
MCGRISRRYPDPAPFAEFAAGWPQVPPRWNIAPSEDVVVLREAAGVPHAELARWGLRPKWLKDPGKAQINARSETAAEKPFFRSPFAHSRCLLVADGWYEWRAEAGGKQPYFFRRKDDRPFTIGGLWTAWSDAAGAHPTCAILTVGPNALAARVHDRMPVLVEESARQRWLDPATPRDEVQALCRPWPGDDLEVHPVATRVNAPRHDDPDCVVPIGPAL